jgi:hypothetical protein
LTVTETERWSLMTFCFLCKNVIFFITFSYHPFEFGMILINFTVHTTIITIIAYYITWQDTFTLSVPPVCLASSWTFVVVLFILVYFVAVSVFISRRKL